MKTLIVYDSLHSNTKDIAYAISKGLPQEELRVSPVERITTEDLKDIQLLIVGSPTHGGTATPLLLEFLKRIKDETLNGKRVAAFDTRLLAQKQKTFLKLLMKVIGYAAPKIENKLEDKGGKIIIKAEGFFVKDTKGPLLQGELERAKQWGESISKKI